MPVFRFAVGFFAVVVEDFALFRTRLRDFFFLLVVVVGFFAVLESGDCACVVAGA